MNIFYFSISVFSVFISCQKVFTELLPDLSVSIGGVVVVVVI